LPASAGASEHFAKGFFAVIAPEKPACDAQRLYFIAHQSLRYRDGDNERSRERSEAEARPPTAPVA
jgi:hypothetical protein